MQEQADRLDGKREARGRYLLVSVAAVAALAACGGGGGGGGGESAALEQALTHGGSHPLVTPVTSPGNFVPSTSGEHQICYDIFGSRFELGELKEFKKDPPTSFSENGVSFTVSDDGKYLSWNSTGGAQVWAVIVKGGPAYNLYNYKESSPGVLIDWSATTLGAYPTEDSGLVSPLQTDKKGKVSLPQISHYNVCYQPPPPPADHNGCTPGYWSNHADRWTGVTPNDDFDTVFGVDYYTPNVRLGLVITAPNIYGTFGFHAIAALLNSYGGVPNTIDGATVFYPYTTAQVKSIVQTAVNTVDDPATGTDERAVAITAAKDQLAAANELGCPLSGTRAVKVE